MREESPLSARETERGVPSVSPESESGAPSVSPGSERGVPSLSPGSERGVPSVSPGSESGAPLSAREVREESPLSAREVGEESPLSARELRVEPAGRPGGVYCRPARHHYRRSGVVPPLPLSGWLAETGRSSRRWRSLLKVLCGIRGGGGAAGIISVVMMKSWEILC